MKILRGSSHFVRVVRDNQIDFNDLIMGDETEVIYIHLCFKPAWPGQINKRYCRAGISYNQSFQCIQYRLLSDPVTCDIDDNPCQIKNSNHDTRKSKMSEGDTGLPCNILMFTSPPNLRTSPKAQRTRGLSAFTKVTS